MYLDTFIEVSILLQMYKCLHSEPQSKRNYEYDFRSVMHNDDGRHKNL